MNSKSDHFITTAHSQIEQKIRKAFKTHKNTVWKKLQSALINIHLSVDIWTSSNKHLLLAVTDDFVEHTEEKHMKTFLVLCKVKDHSEEDQFAVLFLILKNYDITWNLEAVVADNSDTNDTLCQKIEAHFLQAKDIVWNPEHWWLHCLDHIINLAVQAFLFHDVLEMKKVRSCDESEKFRKINKIIKWKF